MPKKVRLTRPELKRYREALKRYQRYLPMLKLKQQRLQAMLREVARRRGEAEAAVAEVEASLARYRSVLADWAGIPLTQWSQPSEVLVLETNVAGVTLPEFQDVHFPEAQYSLFGTPPWVDAALGDLREHSRRRAAADVLRTQEKLLAKELTRIVQRVNLFEKIMIPDARDAIRRIRIKLGDEMTAGVGRSKMAKKKLADAMDDEPPGVAPTEQPTAAFVEADEADDSPASSPGSLMAAAPQEERR